VTTREQITAEALSWLDTPYHDHAGLKGCGVDCAYLPLRVYQKVGKIPLDFQPGKYSPQQWLNSPQQVDRLKLRVLDETFFKVVLQFARRELASAFVNDPSSGLPILEDSPKPGDFVIYRVAASWTHGGIVISWPDYVLHPVKGIGVVGSHGINEGFWRRRPARFFTVFDEGEE
jgi:cell wall-associated NlpC family hydrolase